MFTRFPYESKSNTGFFVGVFDIIAFDLSESFIVSALFLSSIANALFLSSIANALSLSFIAKFRSLSFIASWFLLGVLYVSANLS